MDLTEPEKQLLVAISVLQMRGKPTDRAAVEAFGPSYFGMHLADFAPAFDSLLALGLLERQHGNYGLSLAGEPLGERLQAENPRHRYFYDEFFLRTAASRAHADFCKRVYGRDLCQHGMMDMEQLQALISALGLGPGARVLELGCGNGMVAEYISDTTGASVTGVDTSAVGIAQALERTQGKRSRLAFVQGDMLEVAFAAGSFDAVIAVDAVYFVRDLDRLLQRLREMLAPGGRMGILYSSWSAEDGAAEHLMPNGTPLARALQRQGLAYCTLDFTESERAHWRRKYEVLTELRQAFEAEGNDFLYRNRMLEAESHQPHVAAGRVSRYLYHVAGDITVRPFAWSDWHGLWEIRAEQLAQDGIVLTPEQIPDGPKDVQRGDYEWDFHRMTEVYRSGAGNFWLAWWGDRPAGHVAAQDVGRFVELRRMVVRPQYRRRGIGTRLVKALIEHCAVRGVATIELWTGREDLGRILYEKMGFREIGGCREDYEDVAALTLFRPSESEIRMRLELGARKEKHG